MHKLTVRLLTAENLPNWDAFVEGSDNGTLFQLLDYLERLGQSEIIGVFSGEILVAGFPVIIAWDGRDKVVRRTSYLSPYFAPVFKRQSEQRVYAQRFKRRVLRVLIDYIKSRYAGIDLPLHPSLTDLTPFQQSHFAIELRYTYELRLESPQRIWAELAGTVRNHIRRSAAVSVIIDDGLNYFDFNRAVFYEEDEMRRRWIALVRHLVEAGRGTVFVALQNSRPVGGLFLASYRGVGYNLLSYFERDAHLRGVPSKLIWAAVSYAHEHGLATFDFEGSVLPPVEAFFQSFGAMQVPYYHIHWHREEEKIPRILYYYS